MKKLIIIIGIATLLAVAGFFLFSGNGKSAGQATAYNPEVEFTVNAFRFGYDPNIITANQGDRVKIIINNTDTLHGIRIPDLGIRGDETLEFTTDKKGEFVWYCANMCGNGHMQMQGKLIVR